MPVTEEEYKVGSNDGVISVVVQKYLLRKNLQKWGPGFRRPKSVVINVFLCVFKEHFFS